jgi:plasmid stabilization system protein ParE
MEDGYKIFWTELALEELKATFEYLEDRFSEKETQRLAKEIERITKLISQNPNLFPLTDKMKVRKVVILRFNSMYYRIEGNQVQILSFFSNRQSPKSMKI